MNGHYDEATLADYLESPETFEERAALEAHLDECPSCRDVLQELHELEEALASVELWDAAEAQRKLREPPPEISSLAERLAHEEDDAAHRLARIVASPITFRRANVVERADMRDAGVVRYLCIQSKELREKQPLHALALADAAIELTERIDAERYPAAIMAELRGGSWLERANVLRYLGRFDEALAALDFAERAYAGTPVETFSLALVQYLRSVIYFKTERLEEATLLARRAARAFRHFGEDVRYLHAKIVEGGVLFLRQRFAEALELFRSLIEPAGRLGDVATIARLYGNIANCYLGLERRSDAAGYFARALSLYEDLGLETEKVRTRWSLGRLQLSAGDLDEGVTRLRQAAREFEALGLTSDAALALLDAVEALLAQGDLAEVRRLCGGIVERFLDAGLTGNAIKALSYLDRAVASGRANARLVREVRAVLEAPDEPFTPTNDG